MRGGRRYLPELLLGAILAGPTVAIVLLYVRLGITPYFAIPWDLATLGSLGLYVAIRAAGRSPGRFVPRLVVLGLILALVSIVTGIGNGATDEGRTTIAYAGLMVNGTNPYTHLLVLHYTVSIGPFLTYPVTSQSYDTYLPLVSFVQIPGTGVVGYEAVCVAAWLGMVYLVRRDEFAAVTLASPVIALLASNGFNDLTVLFFLTLSLRGGSGPRARIVEYLTYGMKQFANVFWIAYHAIRRDWLRVALVVPITLVLVLPFLIYQPLGVYCNALTFGWGPGCSSAAGGVRGLADLWDHWNYYVWPVWGYALFRRRVDAWIARARAVVAGRGASRPGPARDPRAEPEPVTPS
ncbi:MAG TPA: hypothetical protein VEL82_03265 [Thermoplasmata archaeon]|nr:hypothetical protein [Thermoplasmata archaeon]